ncbi:hypothetical protein ACRYJU_14855 [Alloalcanivorax xenomutans]|uniref:hypothetical protein n=1 Tax=Alloalcanivorax xenomutans TaxID=1094342 RepID=UPI003D9B07E9
MGKLKKSVPVMNDRSVTNTVSTGGGGTFFEQHVDALFLALLLVRAPLPVLKGCQVEEVHLQTEHLGWQTDDVLVVAARPDGVVRRLAMQVKRRFTVSEKDDTCKKAFGDFWADFRGSEFDAAKDRFALVTLRGTDVLLDKFNSLLDCARASADGADFVRRLEVDGFLSITARGYAAAIRKIIEDAGPAAPTDEEFWRFLCVLHVVSFDLNTASGQTEAWIKALLGASVNEADPLAAAEASWRELLELAGAGMPAAAHFRYEDLSEGLRNRHGQIDTRAAQVIRALSDHSEITLDGIKTTIGPTTEITRDALTNQVLEALNENQVVLISAPAGFGKSAVAKSCVRLLDEELYCLAFRAEEFSVSHIDQMLVQAQVPTNGTELLGMLAGQGRKLAIVESVERLLEASVRDAFGDLLNLAQKDRSLGLLLTCRDYSLETVSSALLSEAGLRFKIVEVPPLTDEELAQAVAAVPQLTNALKHESLNRLLRSPYLLDKAAQMDWSATEGLPSDEREFRRRCWGEVIRRNAAAAEGMPQRRERAFEEVALRRARQLRPFVAVGDLDAGALEVLRADSLIVASSEVSSMVAPGHDVLEDWAIIQWLGERWVLHEYAAGPLAEDVGGFPAIRRAYRKWLLELLRCETEAATDFVLSAFRNPALPSYFRDDTLVCTLQSSSAREFLERHQEALFADGSVLLVRVTHLLRVACKTPLWWFRDTAPVPSQMLVASGEAWPAVLELVLTGLDDLVPQHTPILLGLIEDFASSIDWREPEPKGFEESAKIAFRLLGGLDDYRMGDMRKRTLQVIAKVPRGDAEAFRGLVDRAMADERGDRLSDEVSEILMGGIDGWNACRFLPEEIVRLAKARLLLHEEDLGVDDWHRGSSINVEPCFGIQEHVHLDSFPASSMRGVFLPLLRHHPRRAADFIIELLNHTGSWYGEQRWPYHRLEPAGQITIEVPEEIAVTQWANPRLWNLYRGLSVGPYILQSALMALEAWLLEICDLEGVDVEPWLLKILRESNNVMATAVVASICNAHPEKSGRAALALLSSRELIWMDRARIVQERGQSAMLGIFPCFGINQFYEDERKKSNALPHRGHDLEALAVKLQLIEERREAVFEIIDRHRAAVPPAEEQSEEHRLWRLALHRMDVRGFRAVEEAEVESSAEPASEQGETREKRIYLGPGEIEPDVQELIDQHAPVAAQQERDLSLLNWGNAAWEGRESAHLDIGDWETFLARARACDGEPEPEDFARGGPGMIAAVCARDHWDEMSPEDQVWCVEKLIWEIERECDNEDEMTRHSRGAFQPDRQAAYILPGLLGRDVPEKQRARIREVIAKALTHASDEVAAYAAEGIGVFSMGNLRPFSDGCVAAIAAGARLTSERLVEEREKPYEERLRSPELRREVVPTVRAAIINQSCDLATELDGLDLDDWPGKQAAATILQVFGYQPGSDLAIRFHRWIAQWIVSVWDKEQEDRERHGRRDHRFEQDCFERIARFALKLRASDACDVCAPFSTAVGKHTRDTTHFFKKLVIEEDRCVGETSFWDLWQGFADEICAAPWIERLDARYGYGKELVSAIFLGGGWKENIRHWHRLKGQAHRIDTLASLFRGSATALEAYCRFLHDIGETSLPQAFVIVADSLAAGEPSAMLSRQNTVFLLDSLLRRYIYAEPLRLKSDRAIRSAVLSLLDHLVEAGSSAAYRMRDDFVTPLSGSVSR